ncbi:TlpA family protein disulfide reductase [Phytohabitans rumicis]|nr:thioredoxin family protein [Phytohabitans rumicis]
MAFLAAAVVLLAAICLLNLLLIFAVLRRLREHTDELDRLRSRPADPAAEEAGALIGRSLSDLVTATGDRPELVGFFDAGCSSCHELAPDFAVASRRAPSVAVVTGTGQGVDELVALLAGGPTVLLGKRATDVSASVGIRAYPTFVRVDAEGTVLHAQLTTVDGLMATAPA